MMDAREARDHQNDFRGERLAAFQAVVLTVSVMAVHARRRIRLASATRVVRRSGKRGLQLSPIKTTALDLSRGNAQRRKHGRRPSLV